MWTSRKNLKELSSQGKFREDLYYRLAVVELKVPSLDSRPSDIPMLSRVLIDELSVLQGRQGIKIGKDFAKYCASRMWPGSVRELKNFLERSLVESPNTETLEILDDAKTTENIGHFLTLKELEKQHIMAALERTNWNKGEACKLLGVDPPDTCQKDCRLQFVSESLKDSFNFLIFTDITKININY